MMTPDGMNAVQVHHSLFYLEVLERFMKGDAERASGTESWRLQQVNARL